MSYSKSDASGGGFAPNSYDDPAFQPQAGYNFEQSFGEQARKLQSSASNDGNLQAEYKFGRGISDQNSRGSSFEGMSRSFSGYRGDASRSIVDPSQLWGGVNQSAVGAFDGDLGGSAPLPSSSQRDIVRQHASTSQQFGQITPENSNTPEDLVDDGQSKTQAADTGKLSRSAKARKAANQRHSMSKRGGKSRQGSHSSANDVNSVQDEEEDDDKREKYRERNRVAAAKCRAKKKQSVGGLEEKHREEQATNSFLKRQVMSLRDELSVMRTEALAHDSRDARCTCEGIHQYNHRKAMELTMNHFGPGSSPAIHNSYHARGNDAMRRMAQQQQFSMGSNNNMGDLTGNNFGFPDVGHDSPGVTKEGGDAQFFTRYMQGNGNANDDMS
ncbi:Hypothetical protein R9X50_00479300 [Acrodontium crateriforme]|uniref:BZIP domain-containing protein n=1 Tax=Acrodontium crateriforme TaxID=150365 RepID=A0AAQ3M581_9PEZI|nr:Hypothetical protein R9X50_00479300 [Acrodontium crateriforme]